jgi:hypothetical protein
MMNAIDILWKLIFLEAYTRPTNIMSGEITIIKEPHPPVASSPLALRVGEGFFMNYG